MNRLSNFIILCAILMLIFALVGCQHSRGTSTDAGIAQIHGGLDDAHADLVKAKPHADAVGQAFIDSADTTILASGVKLGAVQKTADADHVARVNAEAAATACEHSVGHRVQVWVTRFFWWTLTILAILYAIHFVCVIAAMVIYTFWPLAAPAAKILSMIGKIVNPTVWFLWALTHIEKKRAVADAKLDASGISLLSSSTQPTN